MKKLILITFLFSCIYSFGQSDTTKYFKSKDYGWIYERVKASKVFIPPSDTTYNKYGLSMLNGKLYVGNGIKWSSGTSSGGGIIDSIYSHIDTVFISAINNTYYFIVRDEFDTDFTVNGVASFLKWSNGQTVPAQGKTAVELLQEGAVVCNHPTYNPPLVSISASPAFGTYEYGTNLGTITLSVTFNKNDAGSATTTTYYQNSSPLGGNTTTISSLTSNQTFYSNVAYGTGIVKNDNCGNADATGQITAGSVNSGTNGYYTGFKYYIGACSGTNPTDAEIRAAAQQTFGSSRPQSNINIAVSGTQYVFYAYPASWGDLTRVWNSLGDFTLNSSGWLKVANTSFTNAQGATVSLNVYTLQAPQSGNVNGLNFQ